MTPSHRHVRAELAVHNYTVQLSIRKSEGWAEATAGGPGAAEPGSSCQWQTQGQGGSRSGRPVGVAPPCRNGVAAAAVYASSAKSLDR